MIKHWIFVICTLCCHDLTAQQKDIEKKAGPTILWEQSSLKQVAPLTGSRNANYARMIQVKGGSLVCVYESAGNIECTRSNDLGNTWLSPVMVAKALEGINMSVPEILELNDKSLLVSYNPRPRKINGSWDTTKHFAICTKKSYDQGNTWVDERKIYQAGYKFEDGCWEPAQVQLPSGEIQLFFSDEGIYTKSGEQNISFFRSDDNGLSWTSKPKIASFSASHRDGMPVPIILNKTNQIIFSIEDNSKGQFKPSIISNSFEQNWQKPVGRDVVERDTGIVRSLPDSVYAGAPYLRQLHGGHTILSYQSTENRNAKWELAKMQVAVGDSNAKNFRQVNPPFDIPVDKHGLWNSLCILDDDTIIAVTSTNTYSDATAIWMIKGRLIMRETD